MSSPQTIQDGEVEALKAIFGDDFTQVKVKTAWKNVPAPIEFCIRVHPEEDELKSQVEVTLRTRLPPKYPNTAPAVSLEQVKGISDSEVDTLRSSLQKLAASLVGSEMVFELVSFASTHLTDHHSIVRAVQHSSLIEERAVRATHAHEQHQRDAEAEARRLEDLKLSEDQELARQVEEHLGKKAELVRKGRERLSSAATLDNESSEPSLPTTFTLAAGARSLQISRGPQLRSGELGQVFLATIGSAEPAQLRVIEIRGRYYDSAQGRAKLAKVLDDLEGLRQLRQPLLLQILASQLSDHRLLVLTEPAPAAPLRDLLDQSGNLRVDRALRYLAQLLEALAVLHEAHFVHRSVKGSNVFLSTDSEGSEPVVKLANASWLQRLADLNNSNPFADSPKEGVRSDGWLCPGVADNPLTYDHRRDLHDLGVLFAQMLFGTDVVFTFASPAALLASLPPTFSEAATGLLSELLAGSKMTAIALSKRLAFAMRNDGTLSSSGPKTPMKTPSFARTAVMPTPMEEGQRGLFWQPQTAPQMSRYRADFEEVEFLGKGGFGRVVKARNRLDGRFYAVKKIVMPLDPGSEEKIRREVTILSRMNHVYIVRYHACWFEVDEGSARQADTVAPAATIKAGAPTPPSEDDSDSDSDSATADGADDDDDDEEADDHTIFDMDVRAPDLNDFLASECDRDIDISYPSIRFGTASATDSTTASRSLTPAPTESSDPDSAQGSQARRTFFMQMEYVDSQTLREAIDRGFDDDVEPWRISRQILQAIVHYVSLHIIHRDLKPSNVFLDAKGDVRVGDFGLAVNQPGQDIDPGSGLLTHHSDVTSDVGTSLYVAPEVVTRGTKGGAKYSEKIDLYSFGVLAFEMWMPLRTGHERIEVIRQLRTPEIKLPAGWPYPPTAAQTRLVKWCLQHDPEKRPSAQELLKSDIFPPQPEEENISEVIRLLIQPDHPFSQGFFPMLFQRPPQDLARRDLAFDFHQADTSRAALDDPYNPIVSVHLSQKFRQRGAIPFDSPLLLPKSDDSRKLVQLLDSDGNVVSLQYDTVGAFARMVARDSSLTRLKRFSLQPVFRENPAGGQPVAIPAGSFDIVSSSVTLAAEAEIIQLADESVAELPLSSDFEHVINHGALWNAVFRNVPDQHREAVRGLLEHYSRDSAASWRELVSGASRRTGLSKAVFEDLRMLFDVCDDATTVQRHFQDSALTLTPLLTDALRDIRRVVELVSRLGCSGPIRVWPLLAPPQHAYCTGIFFETRLTNKRRDILVIGGRYDALVQKLAPPGSRSSHAKSLVSASFAISKLSRAVGRRLRDVGDSSTADEWRPRRCDVYVVSYTDGLVEERLDVMKELWAAGISADLMYDEDWKVGSTSADSILQTCRAEGVLFMVIVKGVSPQVVRVKSVLHRTETEVYLHELGAWLDDALAEHRKAHGGGSNRPSLVKQRTKIGEQLSTSRDFQVILPDDATRKAKHKARNMVLDRVPALVTENAKAVVNLPVYAVELDEPAFTRMSTDNSWLASADAFRARVVDAVPTSRKAYAWQVRDSVVAYAQRSPNEKWIWLFSLRTGACQLLPLTVV